MGVRLGPCSLAFNLVYFSMLWLFYCVKEENHERLKVFLHQREAIHFYNPLKEAGVWNLERLSSASMFVLPNKLLRDRDNRDLFRQLKFNALEQVMLVYWLRDHGLGRYVRLEKDGSLILMGYGYTETVETIIDELDELEDGSKHYLHSTLYRFRQTIREYAFGSQTAKLITKKREYKERIENFNQYLVVDIDQIQVFINDHPITLLHTVIFAVVSHFIVRCAVQKDVPGNSNIIPLILLMYANYTLGCGTLALVLLYKMIHDPVKTFVFGLLTGVWALGHYAKMEAIILTSMLTMITITLFSTSLRFQTLRTNNPNQDKNSDSDVPSDGNDDKNMDKNTSSKKSEDKQIDPNNTNLKDGKKNVQEVARDDVDNEQRQLIICGIGCIDSQLNAFLKGYRYTTIGSYFSQTNVKEVINPLAIDVQQISMEDVDVHWSQIKSLICPSIANGNLKSFSMVNNRAFTDTDAERLGALLNKNTSLQKISIIFDYQKSFLEKLHYFLLWDNCLPQLTTRGVQYIINSLMNSKAAPVKFLDFYGIQLDEKTVQSAKNLNKKKGTKVFGNKPDDVPLKTMLTTMSSWVIKLPCCLSVLAVSTFMIGVCVLCY